jgi:hypothetical protein
MSVNESLHVDKIFLYFYQKRARIFSGDGKKEQRKNVKNICGIFAWKMCT